MTAEGELPSVAHVPMAQGTQGSTLMTVAQRLGEAHLRAGGDAVVVLGRGLVTPAVPSLTVDYGRRHFSREEIVTDWVDGRRGRLRRNYGQVYDAAARALEEAPRDVVLLYEGHYVAATLPRWEGVRRAGSQVCLYVHNPLSRSYGRRELRRLLGRADRVIFCADHLREATAKRVGRRRARGFEVVHNGVDDLFRAPGPREAPEGEFVVLFAGKVAENKGVHLVIEAAEAVRERVGRPVRVRVVGGSRYGAGGLDAYEVSLREAAAGRGGPGGLRAVLGPGRGGGGDAGGVGGVPAVDVGGGVSARGARGDGVRDAGGVLGLGGDARGGRGRGAGGADGGRRGARGRAGRAGDRPGRVGRAERRRARAGGAVHVGRGGAGGGGAGRLGWVRAAA